MENNGFHKFYWAFFFTMLDFRIQGFDIFPDLIGYILFAIGFKILIENSEYFKKASYCNIPMIFLSVLSIYEAPARNGGINFGPFGLLGIPIAIVSMVLNILVVYYLFMGIKDLASLKENTEIYDEADKRSSQFIMLQFIVLISFVLILIPPLFMVFIISLFIAAIILTFKIMKLMRLCEDYL